MAIDKTIKKLDNFVKKEGDNVKKLLRKAAKDAEPVIVQTRKKIQTISRDVENTVKNVYTKKIKTRR